MTREYGSELLLLAQKKALQAAWKGAKSSQQNTHVFPTKKSAKLVIAFSVDEAW